MSEILRVAQRKFASNQDDFITAVSAVQPLFLTNIMPAACEIPTLRDACDQHILNAAIYANVDYLVTGDKDILSLAHILPVTVVNARELLEILGNKG